MDESTAALLVALTSEAEHALGGVRNLTLDAFPVRFGRERRGSSGQPVQSDRRNGEAPDANDVYLREVRTSGARHISGLHFAIECADRQFFLIDRGSACGTIVSGRRVGGDRVGGRIALRDGDEIVVGTSRSLYVFRFTVIADDLGHA